MTTKKDLTDALRERCFPEEVSPSEGSWEGIAGRMRRRAARRRAAAAALAVLVPAGAVLLFVPDRTVPDAVAGLEQPATVQDTDLLAWQDYEPDVPTVKEEYFRPSEVPAVSSRPAVPTKDTADPSPSETAITPSDTAPAVSGPSASKPAAARPVVSEPIVTESIDSSQEYPESFWRG